MNAICTYTHRILTGGLIFILFIPVTALIAQENPDFSFREVSEDASRRYGPSLELLNGEKYNYPYRSARGDPFFKVVGDQDVSLQINGKLYENQTIRYDIYNQLMVLDFKDRSGAPGSIVLRNEWLDYLIIDGYLFKKFPFEHDPWRFGQVIYEGTFSCIYFWEKEYSPDLQQGEKSYRFSDPRRQSFILSGDHFSAFSGKRSFLKCFPQPLQGLIKSHLKESGIRIRKATNLQMQSIMVLINQFSDVED